MESRLTSENRKGPVVLVSRRISYTFPLAYGYLAGYLRQAGEDVRIVFKGPGDIKQIMDMNPLLVGFGSLYPELKEVGDMIKKLNRTGRKFSIVIGGQMVSRS